MERSLQIAVGMEILKQREGGIMDVIIGGNTGLRGGSRG